MTDIALESTEYQKPPEIEMSYVSLVSSEAGGTVLQKITSRQSQENEDITGSQLLKTIVEQIEDTYPQLDGASAVDVIALNPGPDGVYDYIELIPPFAYCYRVVVNKYGTKVNVSQRIPLGSLTVLLKPGSELHVAIQAKPTAHGEGIKLNGQQQRINDAFDSCRQAVAELSYSETSLNTHPRTHHLGGRALRH